MGQLLELISKYKEQEDTYKSLVASLEEQIRLKDQIIEAYKRTESLSDKLIKNQDTIIGNCQVLLEMRRG